MENLTLQMIPGSSLLSNEEFYEFCRLNKGLRIERNHKQEIIIHSPTGSKTSHISLEMGADLVNWNRKEKLGVTFGSEGGFSLEDGSVLAPDVAWISSTRWDQLPAEMQTKFAPMCPDFVIEIKSPSDRWRALQEKAQRWILNGCRMVWLVNPEEKSVEVYSANEVVLTQLQEQPLVSGEPVLPGFVADLSFLLKK
jgi:Uma2 family endonuclease